MRPLPPLPPWLALAQQELRALLAMNPSDRGWHLPLAAALASGLPLLVGAFFGRLDYGLVSSLGGMVFLYTPHQPLAQRMGVVMACALGMTACFALGLLGALHPALRVVLLTVLTTAVTLVCRIYRVNPPGSLFFIMAVSIGAYMPFDLQALPTRVGLLVLGSILATGMAFLYSLTLLRQGPPPPAAAPLQGPALEDFGPDTLIIGLTVGLSLLVAEALQLDRPYWVPVSCLAVIQGASFRMVWAKQAHRIAGTGIGLGLAWLLLSLPMNVWMVCATMILLTFVIELLVVRHYGLAMIFITPLTLFLADAGAGMSANTPALIAARFWDIALGSTIGLLGGFAIHHARSRALLLRCLRPFWPQTPARPRPAPPPTGHPR
ncbi:MAG: FUSC family protein [Burkholderiaceae bacterium]|nr:FUSC family protein [Burkholderiaceae bacterium]